MRKKLILISVIASILAIILVSVWFMNLRHTVAKVEYNYSYCYKVEIITNETGNYVIYAPLPLNMSDDSLSEIVYNLEVIKGNNTTYNVEDTEYGKALEIIGSGSALLESRGENKKFVEFAHLSMYNGTFPPIHSHYVWVFYNMSNGGGNTSINIELCVDYEEIGYNIFGEVKGGEGEQWIETTYDGPIQLTRGWQMIKIEYHIEM